MKISDGLCYDDVLLVPQHSTIQSRADVDISTNLGKGVELQGPYISANMKTVTGPDLAKGMSNWGTGILHRFDSIENQIENYKKSCFNMTGISVGINSEQDSDTLINETGTRVVCIDVAHGDHIRVLNEIERIATKYPNCLLIAGNVASGSGAKRLANAGADVVKCGIGPGAVCSTRVETGNGVPQLSALEDCYNALKNTDTKIIADGGIKNSGDVVKALCFSHAVMLGSVLAGTEEAPGNIIEIDGRKYKEYAGSSTHKTSRVEGVAGLTPYKGSVHIIMQKFAEGLQSGLSYQGCRNLDELRESPVFVRISNAGLKESHPHANLK